MSRQNRGAGDLRLLRLEPGWNRWAEGSCMVSWGDTRVLCTASVDGKAPFFRRGTGCGWVTAEYALLPRSTTTRSARESVRGRQNGRSQEIGRLIGRSLRAAVDLAALGERTITLDCDVLQADGGTRTASITGAYVALAEALHALVSRGELPALPVRSAVAAVSVGLVDGQILTDLDYQEDSRAEVDFNVVMNDKFQLVEIQGTGEDGTFTRAQLNSMLDSAEGAIKRLFELQRLALLGESAEFANRSVQ